MFNQSLGTIENDNMTSQDHYASLATYGFKIDEESMSGNGLKICSGQVYMKIQDQQKDISLLEKQNIVFKRDLAQYRKQNGQLKKDLD